MSVGLPAAQARPSSGLVRGRAGVHEMVDILAIAGYSGARLYRGQSSLYKIVAKPTPGCAAVVLTSCVGKPPETRVPRVPSTFEARYKSRVRRIRVHP